MAARTKRLIVLAALVAATGSLPISGHQAPSSKPADLKRIVSLVPALTEILFAIGAGPQVVAVSSYDDFPPEVSKLPKVGALLDPDTERILALRPDMVVVYGSQSEQEKQFARAGIRTYSYRHGGIPRVLDTIRELGQVTGHAAGASRLNQQLQARLEGVRARVAKRPRVRTVLVIGREPGTLQGMFVSGGFGFLHDMLGIAGGTNVFADSSRESLQPSNEIMLARAPEAIVELSAQPPPADLSKDRLLWSRLASIPAVRQGRVFFLFGGHLVVPGPRLADGTEALARTLHPEAF